MPHCTPEQLALAALREPLPGPDAEHLSGCDVCRREVAELQRGVDALAVPELAAPSGSVAPPPSVWTAIAAQTGVSARPRPEVHAAPAAEVPAEPAEPAAARDPDVGERVADVRVLRPRRSRLLIAAAAALVVGAGIGAGVVALGDRDGGTVVTSTALDPLDDDNASGRAVVVARNGEKVLRIDLTAPTPTGGYYEVWLIDQGVKLMVPVGVVHAGRTDLPLPDGIDLREYPVVDVSVEPLDGNPAHSGDSVARGQLAL